LFFDGSNVPTETFFYLMNYIETEETSRVKIKFIQAMLAVKTSFHMSCVTFSQQLVENPELLKFHFSEFQITSYL